MLKLDLDSITVDTFAMQESEPGGDLGGISQGVECTVTLAGTCTCKCHTIRYDCV